MRLPKSNSIKIISLLLIIDVFFSALLLSLISPKEEAETNIYYEYKIKTQEYALFRSSELLKLIQDSATKVEDFDYGVFVPPYPCWSCMEEQFLFLREIGQRGSTFYIWAPNNRTKQIRALICQYNNCKILSYEEKQMTDNNSIINSLVGLVYFTFRNGMIQDVYLSDSTFPDLTIDFLCSHEK